MSLNKETVVSQMDNTLRSVWGLSKHSTMGLSAIYDEWLEKKTYLRNLLSHHPGWNEDMQCVVTSCEQKNEFNTDRYSGKMNELYTRYSKIVCNGGCIPDSMYNVLIKLQTYIRMHLMDKQSTKDLRCRLDNLYNDYGDERMLELSKFIKVGMKSPKIINKFCELYDMIDACGTITNAVGDTVRWYDKWFASIADIMTTKAVETPVTISIHPCDFFNMSHGTGWKSCHNMGGGGWRAGCISYMLDTCSVVVSGINDTSGDMFNEHKIFREMFMINDTCMLQSRLYPNNDNTPLKRNLEKAVKDVLRVCDERTSVAEYHYSDDVYGRMVKTHKDAAHYKDYCYSQYGTTLFTFSSSPVELTIGAQPISVSVGRKLNVHDTGCGDIYGSWLVCEECGEIIDARKAITIGGHVYCSNCAAVCKECGEAYLKKNNPHADSGLCNDCYTKHHKTCQFCGEEDVDTNMCQMRDKVGRLTGRWAHKRCLTDDYSVCVCSCYQHKEHFGKFTFKDATVDLCSSCSNIINTWLSEN